MMPKIHFKTYLDDGTRLIAAAACRAAIICVDANSSELRNEVTCGDCMRVMMAARKSA